MNQEQKQNEGINRGVALIAGIIFITLGATYLLEQRLRTGWLFLVLLPVVGLSFLIGGLRSHRRGLIIPGGILTGLGVGAVLLFGHPLKLGWQVETGLMLISVALGWLLIVALDYLLFRVVPWWAFVTASVFLATGMTFVATPLRLTDFVLYIVTGLGLALLIWGVFTRLFGLIIPGCLLLGIGPGIYTAWSGVNEPNSVARTGIMLVSFALGWGLITVFSRVVTLKFVWWPLIPGGVLAMTGWGLYIGGNPSNALSFIGNTGSIGLIIFGVYLLLLRRGIHN